MDAPSLTLNAFVPYSTDINVRVNLVIHFRHGNHFNQSLSGSWQDALVGQVCPVPWLPCSGPLQGCSCPLAHGGTPGVLRGASRPFESTSQPFSGSGWDWASCSIALIRPTTSTYGRWPRYWRMALSRLIDRFALSIVYRPRSCQFIPLIPLAVSRHWHLSIPQASLLV